VLSWITCINELSSSIMLYSGKTSTIAIAIYQEVTHMNDGPASALATILTLTTIISLVIVFRLTKGKVKIVFSQLKESDAAILGASALAWEL
jgi:iron(III) transport system permease protein